MSVEDKIDPSQLRASLTQFWNSALEIAPSSGGYTLALPQTGADGWQLLVEIAPATPGKARISDSGRVLGALVAAGQNIEADSAAHHLDTILRQNQVERDGLELFRWLKLPVDPVEVHVFAEALAGISHLSILHEPSVRTEDIAGLTLQRVFQDRKIDARPQAILAGKTEKSVRVDYLVDAKRPVAFEILRRRTRLLPLMEQWGYRWNDIRKITPQLMPVMVYDPASHLDEASRAIGEEVCSLFCSYQETDRIHGVLETAFDYQ